MRDKDRRRLSTMPVMLRIPSLCSIVIVIWQNFPFIIIRCQEYLKYRPMPCRNLNYRLTQSHIFYLIFTTDIKVFCAPVFFWWLLEDPIRYNIKAIYIHCCFTTYFLMHNTIYLIFKILITMIRQGSKLKNSVISPSPVFRN